MNAPGSDYPSDVPVFGEPLLRPTGDSVRRHAATVLAMTAALCLSAALAAAGFAIRAALPGRPTAADGSAAAAAVAGRWRSWPAGRIFPARLSYRTNLLTAETANRVGISPRYDCNTALDAAFGPLAVRDQCVAGLRATYIDQLQGIVYTIGVLAFPDSRQAAGFMAGLPAAGRKVIALRSLALPGTVSARFSDAARQAASARQAGPFVALSSAGYADGRAAAVTDQLRTSVFSPATQLTAEVIGPLTAAVTAHCNRPPRSC